MLTYPTVARYWRNTWLSTNCCTGHFATCGSNSARRCKYTRWLTSPGILRLISPARVLCCRFCIRYQRWHVIHRHTPPTPYVALAATYIPTPYSQALAPRVVMRTIASAVRAMTCNSCDSSLLHVAKRFSCISTYPTVFTHFIYLAQPLLNIVANVGSS